MSILLNVVGIVVTCFATLMGGLLVFAAWSHEMECSMHEETRERFRREVYLYMLKHPHKRKHK